MEEFSIFSAAWLSHDPNDPVCNPNDPGYVSDPNDPDYISESAKANWNQICDLDDNYDVDLDDFASFCDNWLWQACWREGYLQGMGGLGMEGLIMPLAIEFTSLTTTTEVTLVPEPDPVTLEENILAMIEYLDQVIADGAPNAESASEIKAILEEWLNGTGASN